MSIRFVEILGRKWAVNASGIRCDGYYRGSTKAGFFAAFVGKNGLQTAFKESVLDTEAEARQWLIDQITATPAPQK